MSLYIDLSEFFTNPITTGIQRISGELCKYAPLGGLTPVRLAGDGFVAFDTSLIDAIGSHFHTGTGGGTATVKRLSAVENGRRIKISVGDRVLVPEVFDNPERLQYFRSISDTDLGAFRFIAFDMLPLTHPQYFWAGTGIYEYFRLLRRARCCGFISEKTRQDYYRRVKRSEEIGGLVLPLGCDALGPKPAGPRLNRPLHFTAVGTIEPRKNHRLVLEAFEPLLKAIPDMRLSFIGRIGWVSSEFEKRVMDLNSDPHSGFRFISAPSDGELRRLVEQSRATVYLSAGEGYGLPPVESLWVGTPVIASDASPSLERVGSQGVHLVSPLDVVNVRRAVLAFADPAYANRKAEEAFRLQLPSWRSFAEETMAWAAGSG